MSLEPVSYTHLVGFNDAKYFTKRFKTYTGVSPNEYRKLFA